MNEQVTEHRGWSTTAEPVHRHFNDDPDIDIASDYMEGGGLFFGWLITSILLIVVFIYLNGGIS